MATYSQALRPFRVTTPLGEDAFLVERFTAVERVSSMYSISLDLVSENRGVDPASLLRKPLTLTFDTMGGEPRLMHGIVRSFRYAGPRDDLSAYHAEVVPWTWLLTLTHDSKIHQQMHALDIVQRVFEDKGFKDFQVRCMATPPVRDHCVQYRETHFDFVSRLLEEEGIFFFFEHAEDKHTLVLADHTSAVKHAGAKTIRMAPSVGSFLNEEVIWELTAQDAVGIRSVLLADYNPLTPSQQLWYPQPGPAAKAGTGDDAAADFQYPARHDALGEAERQHNLRIEAEESLLSSISGWSSCRSFRAGARIDIADHPRDAINQPYHLISVTHSGSLAYRPGDERPFEYSNEFVAIPHTVPFRPARRTPKPVIPGSQTAVVAGPKGNEIHVDKHGRVKVKFHWDPQKVGDDKSSCWVRVASPWAGKGWGMVHIPRIGQEVVVQFLDGDPDRPLIVGGVYNADQVPPYTLPANQTQSGIKSRSTPDGGAENCNELRFEDKKGKEEILLHAEKDLRIEVENDTHETIGHDHIGQIKKDRTFKIEGSDTLDVTGDQSISSKGKIKITAVSEIKLEVGGSSITISPTEIKIAAAVGVKVEGGAQAELSGGAQTTVKGAIVMIN
jgi:type VI secretion system secreted protein VgrG